MRAKKSQAPKRSRKEKGHSRRSRVEARFSTAPDFAAEAQLLDQLIGAEIAALFENVRCE